MTVKRFVLIGLTCLVGFLISLSLLDSWTKPQVQNQLELYQTNLLLHAAEWQQVESQPGASRTLFLGTDPVDQAIEQYQEVHTITQTSLNQLRERQATPSGQPQDSELDVELGTTPVARSRREKLGQVLDKTDLRLGILYAVNNQTTQAQQKWQTLIQSPQAEQTQTAVRDTARVLSGLWSTPPRLLPDAEDQLQEHLTGWFRYQSLAQLYRLQQRQDALAQLQAQEQQTASSAVTRLALVSTLPALGGILGGGLLLIWFSRELWQRRQRDLPAESPAIATGAEPQPGRRGSPTLIATAEAPTTLASPPTGPWLVPWDQVTIWQVMVLWFVAFFGVSFGSSFILALVIQLAGLDPANLRANVQALVALGNYLLLMTAGFAVLYFSLRGFLPKPLRWFRYYWKAPWLRWGLGGYLAAMPLVLIVSLLNQQLLKDQGGGNPLLEIILQSNSSLTIAILFLMVSVLAPLFEETLFRGFLLTSLTRYLPPWGAIAASGLLFAIAHLNLSDILPLTVLGMVLGYVYLRSGNLLSSILLHSLWNSGSFVALLVLGSSAQLT